MNKLFLNIYFEMLIQKASCNTCLNTELEYLLPCKFFKVKFYLNFIYDWFLFIMALYTLLMSGDTAEIGD